jgi:serine/threonine protein kinase
MPELPLVGNEFAGYRMRSVLGRGGMSVVYQAENLRLGNVIALKVLAPELAADDVFRARFLEESRIAASLNHPNVIPIYDMGPQDGLLFIAMRYVSGTDLRQMIKKRGRLLPETALFLLGQAARALDTAHHRGLVHRDVKPGNLLIERGGDEADPDHLYLADFGITKHAMSRTGLTSTGQFLGTSRSTERWRGGSSWSVLRLDSGKHPSWRTGPVPVTTAWPGSRWIPPTTIRPGSGATRWPPWTGCDRGSRTTLARCWTRPLRPHPNRS